MINLIPSKLEKLIHGNSIKFDLLYYDLLNMVYPTEILQTLIFME